MASKALVVAGIAAVALVAVVSVDLSMNRTYALELWTGASWTELVRDPYRLDEEPYYRGETVVEVNRSDDVRLRVRLDNGYFNAHSVSFRVTLDNGAEVAAGTLSADARSEAAQEFTIPAARLLSASGSLEPKPAGANTVYPSIQVLIDGDRAFLGATFGVREVSR